MKKIKIGKKEIKQNGSAYVIAEIGHNHQGNLETALKMLRIAAECGVDAVKLQKRDNKALFTKALYDKPYDNENSYGATYGEHREFLEFGMKEYQQLKKYADELGLDFFATAFDFPSVDFLEELGVPAYKIASGDITNIPLLTYIAKTGKPMIVSTGASTLEEVKMAYEAITKYNDQLCFMHCVAGYPADYPDLHLNNIITLKEEFPDVVIGYSGHDNGILAAIVAHMLGATVIEKHFTLNRAWKGTDHKFSLEPEGLRKQIRDLQRIPVSLGGKTKKIHDFEKEARKKMGKSIYIKHDMKKGEVLKKNDLVLKSPGGEGLEPYYLDKIIGKKIKKDLIAESPIRLEYIE